MKRWSSLRIGLGMLLCALPLAGLAQQAFTTRTVYLRAGPDNSYPLVVQIAPGTPLYVQGCLEDWSWCDVEYANFRGWTWAPYLNYVYQDGRVPLYNYAPSLGIPIVVFSLGPYWDRYYYGRPWYGRRDYWMSRPPPPHYRPPGPPPRTGPPPPRPPQGGPPPRPPMATPNPAPRPPGDVRTMPAPSNGGQQPPANRPPPSSQRPPSSGGPPTGGAPPGGQPPAGPPPGGAPPAGGAPMTRN